MRSDSTPPRNFHANGRKRGFTLIELSVVLVVIGLLVGGILVGRDLIKAGEIRSMLSEVQFKLASTAFRTKYGCVAGDCNNATSFFSGATNGDGDGFVSANVDVYPETYQFFYQLNQSGLLPGSYTGTGAAYFAVLGPKYSYYNHFW